MTILPYVPINFKNDVISLSEVACLANGTCIGYSSPLTLTDQVNCSGMDKEGILS